MTTIILGISTILQFIAAALSVRLIFVTGNWTAWILFAIAMIFMGVRKTISLYHIVSGNVVHSADLTAELIALSVSILMVTGMLLIAPIFRKIQSSNEELELSNEKYEEAVNFFPQAINEADSDGNIIFTNHAGSEIFGQIDKRSDQKVKMKDLVIPEERERGSNNINSVLKGETIGPNRYMMYRKDGSTFPALVYSGPIMSAGNVTGIRSLILDNTEREQAEEILRTNEANLREAQRIAHLGFWKLDLADNTLSWSDEVYSIFGVSPDSFELTMDSVRNMIHPEDRKRVEKNIIKTLRNNVPHKNDYRIILSNGKTRYINSIGEITRDKNGEPTGLIGTLHDITELKLTEKKLRESEEKHREVVNFLPQIILETDLQGNTVFSNTAGREAFGEIKNTVNGVAPEDRKRAAENIQKALQGETTAANEYTLLRKDGSTFPALVYSGPIFDAGEISGIRSLIIDITKRRQAEDKLQRSEANLKDAQRVAEVGSWEFDLDTGRIYWSDEIYNIFDLDLHTFEPTLESYLRYIHPDDLVDVESIYSDYDKTKQPYDITYRLISDKGNIKFVNERCRTVFDDTKNPVRSVGTLQDITKYRLTQNELRESEEKYRTLVESSPYCIHQIDSDGMLISMNRAGLQMLGLADENAVRGLPYLDSVCKNDRERISQLMRAALAGESADFEFRSTADLVFRSNFVPIFNTEGNVDRLLGISQDITEKKRAENALIQSEARFRGVFEQAAVGVALVDAKTGKVLRINQYYCDMLGYTQEEVLDVDFFRQITHPDDLQEDIDKTEGLGKLENLECTMDKRYIHKNGSIVWVNFTLSSIIDPATGSTSHYIGIVQNINERKLAEDELRKLSRGVEASSSGVTITDLDGVIEYVNPKFTEITGYTREEVIGQNISLMRSGETPESTYDDLWETIKAGDVWKGELRDRKKDGSLYWNRVSITGVKDAAGNITHVIGNQEDVTHEYELSEQLTYQATHDALTGLVNRGEFERRTERLLSTIRQDKTEHALCYMDLDQFKVVNDTCGHTAGDEMMRQLSSVLQGAVRKRDTLARLGGDEFGVLMEHCSPDHAHRVASNLQQVIQDYQFVWEGHVFKVGVSIGLVAINETFANLTELLKQADAACYMAKDLGRNRIHVYHGDDASLAQRHGEMQWVTRIYQALEQNRFCLFAQTIVPLNSSRNRHYELLLRMEDEAGQLIPPGAFLPAAERYNLIEQIDTWVIEKAFSLLAANPVFLNQVQFVSINLSGQSLTKSSFLDIIIRALEKTGVEANKICFEITETTAITNLSAASTFISTLKALGCQFALDDFGSGLSSFGYLKNLSVDYLKIDGMFVKDIVDDPIDHAMVKSINEIGHVMGMQTIAEFVENDEIKGMLREIGVNYAQGYGIGKPQAFDELLRRSNNVTIINGDLYSG